MSNKIAPPANQRPDWYKGYVGDNDHVFRAWREGLPARSHNSNLRSDGESLWSWDTRIGRTWDGKKQLLDVRGSKAYLSHTTSEHVNLAEPYSDEVVQPVIVSEVPKEVLIGREYKHVPDHWCYFPHEGFGDEPTDQTDYKVVFRLDGRTPLAIFPEIPMDVEGKFVQIFDPRAGIKAGDYDEVIKDTRPAPVHDERILQLMKELQQRGYTYIKPVGRATDKMHEARGEAAKQGREIQGKKPFSLDSSLDAFERGELPEEDEIELFQHLVDTGLAWKLSGRIGVHAFELIEKGKVFR